MGVIELIDETATTALAHATELQARLRSVGDADDPSVCACKEEAHHLLNDIISLRNAAELLMRMPDGAP
jgi:hypothetical protein